MLLPKISVVMPVYNAEAYIIDAIESILNQTFNEFEFIIIDDCSKDGCWEIIQKYARQDERIVAIRNDKNLKISKTLNKGIAIAKGKYIARMDADDCSYTDRLEKQYMFMEENPDIGICGGTMEVCDEHMNVIGTRKYKLTDKEIRKKIFYYSPFCHASTIYKTKYIQSIKGYNEYLYDAEDYDMYFRIGLLGKFANITDIIYRMRTNPNGVSILKSKRQEKLTLYIRIKAITEYGYKMRLVDKIYLLIQILNMYIMPQKVKIYLFNLIRNSRK